MKVLDRVLGWAGSVAASVVGGLVILVAAVSLIAQSPEAGARTGWAVLKFAAVSLGIVFSYLGDIGPAVSLGQRLGEQTSAEGR